MPNLKTYDLFLSHVWRRSENSEYYRLENMLSNAMFFSWRNYSVPEHDPLETKTDAQLHAQIENRIRAVNCFVVVAGMYVNYRKWIQRELDLAIAYDKPIVGVIPWGQQRVPSELQQLVDEMVGWNTESIVGAIRRVSI